MAVNNINYHNNYNTDHKNSDEEFSKNVKLKEEKYKDAKEINDQDLINACAVGDINVIKEYLECGHDVNKFLKTDWTLLLYASTYGQPNLVKYLLDVGANPNLHHEGFTPLMALCFSTKTSSDKCIECLKYLIERKADVNATSKLKETALMYACKMQDIDFVSELLKYVKEINFTDSEQNAALFYAVLVNKYDIVKLLIENGADISLVNYNGLNAYDVANAKGYDKLIPLLTIDCNNDEEDYIEVNCISSWVDMFPMIKMNKNKIDNDIVNLLYGMGLDSYNSCFCGIDLKNFLKLTENDLEKLGIDISVHRKRFINELFKFHKHPWSENLMKINKAKPFDPFSLIKMLGNINKQLIVISGSIHFSKNSLDAIKKEESDFSLKDQEIIQNKIKNMQENTLQMKDIIYEIQNLSKTIKKENSNLCLPIYISKKKKIVNKWIIVMFTAIASIYLLKMDNIKKLLNHNTLFSKSWRNVFHSSLINILFEKRL